MSGASSPSVYPATASTVGQAVQPPPRVVKANMSAAVATLLQGRLKLDWSRRASSVRNIARDTTTSIGVPLVMFVLDTAADRAALAAAAVVESGARVMMFWRLLLLQLVAARVACRKD